VEDGAVLSPEKQVTTLETLRWYFAAADIPEI
jgi:hypothetical protein